MPDIDDLFPPKVRPERTGWRDQKLSERHRKWGFNCPAQDIDFLMIEYDHAECVALVEYKHEYSEQEFTPGSFGWRVLVNLGDRAFLPAFYCRYGADLDWYCATPMNDLAKTKIKREAWGRPATEKGWVSFLYRLRGYEIPKDVLEILNV